MVLGFALCLPGDPGADPDAVDAVEAIEAVEAEEVGSWNASTVGTDVGRREFLQCS